MPTPLSVAIRDFALALTGALFFAIYPNRDVAEHIAQLARRLRAKHGMHDKPIAAERLHVTLLYLGNCAGMQPGSVDKAAQTAAAIAMPPFDLAFDRAASFSGRVANRPFVLQGSASAPALTSLRDALVMTMKNAGLVRGDVPRYIPHMTLPYDDRSIAEQVIDPVSWTVREFVLVRSLVGQARHVPLARLPLLS
jgi:2'-5' RNA ligase